MLLHEVYDASDRDLLFIERIAKEVTIAVNMQTTGTCVVRGIVQTYCFCHNLTPVHGVGVVIQRHRMTDNFKSIVETSIVLAVDAFFIEVCDITDFLCIAVTFSTIIDLQFHAHKQRT